VLALPRKHHRIVSQTIDRWRQAGMIDDSTAARLSSSTTVAPFDWKRTARYAFIVSIVCVVITIGALLADTALMQALMRIFAAPDSVKCGALALVAAGLFRYGLFLRGRHPHRRYGNEAVFFLGVLALAAAIYFLGMALDTGAGHYAILFLIASVLYALLGLWFPSPLVWVFGLLSLGTWMGTETGYVSGGGMYFLGMNYPLRFAILGAALSAVGIAGEHWLAGMSGRGSTLGDRLLSLSPQTKVIGLLNLFIALWIMSIFGNYGDMMQWREASRYELLPWSLVFGAVAIAAIWYGLKRDDEVLRGFGLTFLFINLYTRYFEYFWNSTHKAIFFAVLAASFWFLGRRAESIWHFGERPSPPEDVVRPTPAISAVEAER